MEEDLKTLESYIKDFDKRNKYCLAFREDLLKIAIKHLIQAYKDQQAELEKKDKIIEQLNALIDEEM